MSVFFLFVRQVIMAQNCPLAYAPSASNIQLNDSVSIAYTEKGRGKTTLLFIHGLGGNSSHWSQNLEELATNYRCIAVDLPGYGLSTQRAYSAPTLTFYASTLLAFMEKKQLKNVVLVGHSMGGQAAIITALKRSPIIKKLILVAPAGLETFSEAETKMLRQFATPAFYQSQTEPAIRAAFASNFTSMPTAAEALIQDRLALRSCEGFQSYCNVVSQGVNGMLSEPVQAQLVNLSIPTLLIFGEDDKLIPNRILHKELTTEKVAEIGKARIPDVQLAFVPQAGHLVMFEKPSQFNKLITNFLK